jgi:hypothetical protein
MKKAVLGLLMFFVLGCTKDDNANLLDVTLCKKVIVINSNGKEEMTYNYIYDGNKLFKRTESTNNIVFREIRYFYTNNLISQINVDYIDNPFPYNVDYDCYYTYDKVGQLIKEENNMENGIEGNTLITYTFNEDKTITANYYEGSVLSVSNSFTILNNDFVKATKATFAYDDKNSPFKNIIGNNPLISPILPQPNLPFTGTNHNCTKINGTGYSVDCKYEYDLENYPIKVSISDNYNTTETYYFFY